MAGSPSAKKSTAKAKLDRSNDSGFRIRSAAVDALKRFPDDDSRDRVEVRARQILGKLLDSGMRDVLFLIAATEEAAAHGVRLPMPTWEVAEIAKDVFQNAAIIAAPRKPGPKPDPALADEIYRLVEEERLKSMAANANGKPTSYEEIFGALATENSEKTYGPSAESLTDGQIRHRYYDAKGRAAEWRIAESCRSVQELVRRVSASALQK